MRRAEQTPVVPLEAGAGPENPPCPACGEPLFGWIDERPGLAGPVRRCESCGLGVVGEPGGVEEALRELDRLGAGEEGATIADRGGFAAWIGGAGWAGLERGARYLFTVEAARRLVAHRDQVVKSARWSPAGVATMWQTILNGFTFGRNVALGALGRSRAVPADKPWQRRLDALIGVVVAIPALLVAVPMELIAAALGRGGARSLRFELL